jgi:hypothetical protein
VSVSVSTWLALEVRPIRQIHIICTSLVAAVSVTVVDCVTIVGIVVVSPSIADVLVVVAAANVIAAVNVAAVVVANGDMRWKAEQNACASCLSRMAIISGSGT